MKLKPILFTGLFCFLFLFAFSQQSTKPNVIRGIVIDSANQKPLNSVTVNLNSSTGKLLKSIITKKDGSFLAEEADKGSYIINLICIGYKPRSISIILDSLRKDLDMGKLYLNALSTELKEVKIVSQGPLIKQEADRISYNVQADTENKAQNALDILRKVPFVTVDAVENIQVKGSGSFKVLINGRSSSIVAQNLKDVLKGMPAYTIQKIEVITTPPAKYDSEGLAGIINIITVKKMSNGYNGGVGLSYSYPSGPGASLNTTIKQGKLGMQAAGNLSYQFSPQNFFGFFRQDISQSQLIQTGNSENKGSLSNGNVELSYETDTLNLITSFFGFNNHHRDNILEHHSTLYNESGNINQSYHLSNTGDFTWNGLDMGLNYQLGFHRSENQLLTGSFQYIMSDNNQNSLLENSARINYNEADFPDLHQTNSAGSKEQTFQLDYIHPIKKITVEGGIKSIFRNNFSDYRHLIWDQTKGEFVLNDEQSDYFEYKQNILAFYNSYQLKSEKWSVKAGLRLERTIVNATSLKQDYVNFVPSVSIQHNIKDFAAINFGFTQRLERPGIWALNPFVDASNRQFIKYGNPELKEVLNNNFELAYSNYKKGYLNIGLIYTYANNTIQSVAVSGSQTWENIGNNKSLGTRLSITYPITKKLNFNLNSSIFYVLTKGAYQNELYENKGLNGYVFSYGSYTFSRGWRAGINGGYYSPQVILQGRSGSYYFTSFSISKELFKQGSLSFYASNPFSKYRKIENYLHTTHFTQSNYNNLYFRNFSINFNYRFGKLEDQIKKNKRRINNDDVKDTGKSNMN